ncbi:MAG: hypothetical protein IPP77_02290 [Bacteroidetes bacterium]|nr:hypothetical protein [Bacteroidota bacterium]
MMMLVRSMVAGMNLFCMRPSIHPLRELDEKLLFDFAAFTPMQLADISGDRTIFNQAQNIRRVILGGEEIRYGILEEIKKMTNEVYATFGMTETISHVALKRLNGTKPDQYFRTLPGISVAANEMDCLIVHAPQLGQQNLLTKDLVKVISETEFEWLGRIDNVINRGGVKIHPEKIEALLEPYISCPFFIAEINSGSSEAKLLLILETTQVKEEELLTISKAIQALDKLNRPQQIWLLREFKRTENGKIRRRETLESGKEVQQIALPFI